MQYKHEMTTYTYFSNFIVCKHLLRILHDLVKTCLFICIGKILCLQYSYDNNYSYLEILL
jgi:hypothetical protein